MTTLHLPVARSVRLGAAGLVAAATLSVLSGCGSSASPTGAAAPTNASATGGAGNRGSNSADFRKIQECLTAAGIAMPTPSGGVRTRTGTARPSGSFSRSPRPSGSGGFGGGRSRMFSDPKIVAALEACGITVPTGGANPGGVNPDGPKQPNATDQTAPTSG